uniref:Uncharacterized protein LOC105033176 n=1 Tax=Elaeis guineensis var. tenera TaxID=51953 RepID=A0A6J0PAQ2_ELAGV|nr:uncharacterized protein LOC105033176 [Elaeis guineensis]
MREPNIPSVVAPDAELVIALSAPTILPSVEVPSVGVETTRDEDATAVMTVVAAKTTSIPVPSAGVQAEFAVAAELESSAAMQTIPQVPLAGPTRSRAQSNSDFMMVSSERPPTRKRGKAPAFSAEDGSSTGLPTLFDIQILVGESVSATPMLAKRFTETALLPTDRENKKDRTMFEIFSSFYPTILKGIDPTSTANLFSEAVCIGEKIINGDECFILKLEANPATLRARSSATFEIIHHTIWGYFSRRIGLLIHLEDSHLLCVKSGRCGESIFWETGMESVTKDYCYINAINIVHAGETHVTPFRYAWVALTEPQEKDGGDWSMQEVDFNTWGWGLSTEVLLPPADFKREEVGRVLPPADLKREEVGRTL